MRSHINKSYAMSIMNDGIYITPQALYAAHIACVNTFVCEICVRMFSSIVQKFCGFEILKIKNTAKIERVGFSPLVYGINLSLVYRHRPQMICERY